MHSKRIMHRGREVILVLSQTLDVLSFLNILDIKPANIFLDGQGTIKLGDLGLGEPIYSCKCLTFAWDQCSCFIGRFFPNQIDFTHSKLGTPYYMSPERINQWDLGYSFSADIWSLGCVLHEVRFVEIVRFQIYWRAFLCIDGCSSKSLLREKSNLGRLM